MQSTKQLGQVKITKLLLQFSIPATVGMLVNALYNVVDRIFVGNGAGRLALSAITVEFPMTLVVMAFNMLIGVGASTLISIRLGEGRNEEAQEIMGNAFVLFLIIGALVTVFGLIYLEPILALLGASPEVMPYAKDYAGILTAGTLSFTIGMGMNNMIRAEGNPRMAMATMLIGAITNIILDPVFIYIFKWGIKGAAIATIIGKIFSAIWVLRYFFRGSSQLRLNLRKIKMKTAHILSILSLGVAPFLMQLVAGLLNLFLNNSLMLYGGDLAMAAMGVVNGITNLMLMPLFGISQGLQPIIGYNYGARNYSRVKEALYKGMLFATAISVLGFAVIMLFPSQLVALFGKNDADLIAMGAKGLRQFLFTMPIFGVLVVGSNYFQAVGKPKRALFLSLTRQLLFFIPSIIILPKFWGLPGIFYSGPASDVLATTIMAIFLTWELKRNIIPKTETNTP
ncbi:MAG TPA: MATE family efflux transporter [Bacillota bacterium]|nr:MATE family efflux transporter [Bacillota bacterium]HPZ21729.1 MATE family efflux transporter [Bacillota bacterium]HQD19225.1 MATE family efflux transporter [Bacillota bacterium]